jgi:dipeptide transport system permease protein
LIAFLLKRLALLLPTFIGITLAAFFLIRLVPGDPIEVMVGERKLDAEAHARLVTQLGLDQPLLVQYGRYLKQTVSGDLGTSIVSREPVSREFAALFPATIELALAALVLALVVGVTLGAL